MITKEHICSICYEHIIPKWNSLSEDFPDFLPIYTDEEKTDNESLWVYPNPTNGKFNIEARNITEVEIVNVMGQNVATYNINEDSCEIDLSGFNTGMYFINVKTENGTMIKKIILTN